MPKTNRYLAFLVLLPCLQACGSSAARVVKPEVPKSEVACVAKGGHWTTLGLPMPDKPKMCDLRATDAGHSCTDGSQCQGECLASVAAIVGSKGKKGTCSAYLSNFGNVLRIRQGAVEDMNVE